MAKKAKKSTATPASLPIPCTYGCTTCVQCVKPGDVVNINGHKHQVAERRDCACVTTQGTILYCDDFAHAKKRVGHLPLPRLEKKVINLVAEFRI